MSQFERRMVKHVHNMQASSNPVAAFFGRAATLSRRSPLGANAGYLIQVRGIEFDKSPRTNELKVRSAFQPNEEHVPLIDTALELMNVINGRVEVANAALSAIEATDMLSFICTM